MESKSTVRGASREDIDTLFARQLESYQRFPVWPRDRRHRLLTKLREMVVGNVDAIKAALACDFRKPAAEVELAEIAPLIAEVDFALAHLEQWMAEQEVPTPDVPPLARSRSSIVHEPKGVCLIIAPWNYPFMLMLGPLASCLAGGNRAILKPSEHTPHASALLETMVSASFAPDEVGVVQGDARVAAHLLDKPFHHIFYTGGTEVGRIVMRHAAAHLSSCTLELGGKSPVIVDETADIDLAAQKIAWGKTFNAGQTCIAPDYVLVHERVKEQLIAGINATLDLLYGASDDELCSSAKLASIVNEAHFRRLSTWIDEAVRSGARVVRGNTKDRSTRQITPTVLTEVDREATLMREEIFGPVIPIVSYTDLDAVVAELGQKPKPLALYFFSRDSVRIDRVLSGTSSGGVCINDVIMHFFSPFLPFGGANASGMGRAHGLHGFKAFTNEKAVLRSAVVEGRS